MTTEEITCPICMDDLVSTANFTKTECGHCFHTSCLMRNVAHNGFGCPYCREKMAEEPDTDEDSEYEDEMSEISHEESGLYDDNALTSMRMLFQQVNGEEIEEEPETEESVLPSTEVITQKLTNIGITYTDLVRVALMDHESPFYDQNEKHTQEIFGLIRVIIKEHDTTLQTTTPEEERVKNIFTTKPMPNFDSMTSVELECISEYYDFNYIDNLRDYCKSLWRRQNLEQEGQV
jgi:hypothetical protein